MVYTYTRNMNGDWGTIAVAIIHVIALCGLYARSRFSFAHIANINSPSEIPFDDAERCHTHSVKDRVCSRKTWQWWKKGMSCSSRRGDGQQWCRFSNNGIQLQNVDFIDTFFRGNRAATTTDCEMIHKMVDVKSSIAATAMTEYAKYVFFSSAPNQR